MKEIKSSIYRLLAIVATLVIVAMPGVVHADSNSGDNSSSTDSNNSASSSNTNTSSTDHSSSSSSSSTDSSSPSSSSSSSDQKSSESTSSSSSDKTPQNTEQETEVKIEDTNSKDGQNYVNGLLNSQSQLSASARTQNCQASQNGLQTMLKSIQTNATNFDTKINTVFTQAQAYQKSTGTNPANYNTLLSAATAAQLEAQAAVSALGTLNVNLNCSSSAVAVNVATFRAAMTQARTYLVAYQQAVNKVLVVLEA